MSTVIRDDFKLNPKNTKVAVGDPAVLECRAPRGQPDPRTKWKKNGKLLEENNRISFHENGNMVISDARKGDSGTYVCVASNVAGDRESTAALLSVSGNDGSSMSAYINSRTTTTS